MNKIYMNDNNNIMNTNLFILLACVTYLNFVDTDCEVLRAHSLILLTVHCKSRTFFAYL